MQSTRFGNIIGSQTGATTGSCCRRSERLGVRRNITKIKSEEQRRAKGENSSRAKRGAGGFLVNVLIKPFTRNLSDEIKHGHSSGRASHVEGEIELDSDFCTVSYHSRNNLCKGGPQRSCSLSHPSSLKETGRQS